MMHSNDEGARVVAESIPAGLPSCDLTDDFLADLDQFVDNEFLTTTLLDQTSSSLSDPTMVTDILNLPELAAEGSQPPAANVSPEGSDSRQRKLQSNRLAQARMRERKKVNTLPTHMLHVCAFPVQQRAVRLIRTAS